MIKQLLAGSAAAFLATGSASALTMTINDDNRLVNASAAAGQDGDSDMEVVDARVFDAQVSASAQSNVILLTADGGSGGGAGGFIGAVANASAGQFSEIDEAALLITASGHADASGNHGRFIPGFSDADSGAGGGGGLPFDGFQANATSDMVVLFSIDEDAAFDLTGFLFAGNELSDGPIGNDINNMAGLALINTDTLDSIFETEISDDSEAVDESGVLAAGNYRFVVSASAAVFGFGETLTSAIGGGGGDITNGIGYATSAGFKGIGLQLSEIDQPIPEPVTTTLAAMGLGALVLRTSRRRHH